MLFTVFIRSPIIVIISTLVACCSPFIGNAQQFLFDGEDKNGVTRQSESIPVSFITVRNKTGSADLSNHFGGNRGTLQTGVCSVEFSPIWGVEDIAESIPFYLPDEKIELTDVEEIMLTNLYQDIETYSDQANGNLVLYVHGYNIDFEKSCRRTALLQRSLGLHDRLLLFSWPADGNMLKYTWDEADLVWSVPHIAGFLEHVFSLTGTRTAGNVDVVAHSLGARGVFQALVRLSYRYSGEQIIDELVLIAPDIDTELFQQDLEKLSSVVGRITVYVSENDRALRLSEEVHGYPRLGQAGENLTIFEGVESIDLSIIPNKRLSGHLYHLFSPEVINDLTELLHTGKPANQRTQLERMQKKDLPYWRLQPGDF